MNRPWRPGLIFGIVLGFCIGGGIFGEWKIKDEFHRGYEVGAWQAVLYANCSYGLPPLSCQANDLEDWAWNYRPLYRRNHDGHWVCDKGYEPDGLDVTWPNGVFTPQPARCKAKEKP